MKLVVWEGAGEKIIHVSCDVDDEEVMLKVVLQDLKRSLVSNVESKTLFILGKAKRCACHYGHVNLDQGSARTIWAIRTLIKVVL